MKNVNDENIDELFRLGLNPESDDFTSMENDFTKLEKRLSQYVKRKKLIVWLRPLIGVAVLLLLFFSIWLLIPSTPDQSNHQIVVQEENQEPNENQTTTPEKEQEINISSESKSTVPLNGQTLAENFSANEKKNNSPAKMVRDIVDSATYKKTDILILPASQPNTVDVNESNEALAVQSGKTKEVQNKPTITQNLQVEEKSNLLSEPWKEHLAPISADKEPLIAENKILNIPEIAEPKSRSFALSILVSSDYNGVNTLDNGKMGNNIGLLVTYGLTKRWSFSTGAVYAKKLYGADYASYNPQKDIWTGYRPKLVDADCRVLDIPLNINYTFLNRNRTLLSIGTGISSYIMLKEYYKFTYYNPNTSDPQDYTLINKNQHWLSVLNLQANYTRKLTSELSLSLQPYMKIPISEIGFAQVKLESLGLAISASWNFNL